MNDLLDKLLQANPALWHGNYNQAPKCRIPTGFAELDAVLPGGGWPVGALTEIFTQQTGIGELRLLLPALVHLSHKDRRQAWIAPPSIPYAPALVTAGVNLDRVFFVRPNQDKDALWAVEQTLRSGVCSAVLSWVSVNGFAHLRRLALAAKEGNCWGILFRALPAAETPSPAALRIRLCAVDGVLKIHIFKAIGALHRHSLHLTV
jgi:hypothetical protein